MSLIHFTFAGVIGIAVSILLIPRLQLWPRSVKLDPDRNSKFKRHQNEPAKPPVSPTSFYFVVLLESRLITLSLSLSLVSCRFLATRYVEESDL
jgi:hypothetical protein